MIEIQDVSKQFDCVTALRHLTLKVQDGSVFGLVGSNGAGKSTLLRILAGVYRPDSGRVLINGQAPFENEQVKRSTVFISDYPYLAPTATVRRLARLYRSVYPGWSEDYFARMEKLFPISFDARLGKMSKGMQRQAAILLGLSTQPRCILFDEIFDGLDPVVRELVKKLLVDFEDELETYLVKISSMQLSLENSMQVSKLSHAIGNFERIGDYAVNILKTKRTMHEDKIHFSKEASKELEVMSSAVQEIITKATNAFIENDVAAAQTIEPLEQVIDNLKAELRARHTKRLQAGECTIENGMLFFDIVNSFERIADHCSNLAVCIIELSQGSYQTHRYLKSVKSQENARFMESFEDYLRKYALH